MPVRRHHSSSWDDLVASLAEWLTGEARDPFVRPTVVVSSRSVARVLPQQLALALPTGICAGVAFATVPEFLLDGARRHGMDGELRTWGSAALDMACADALEELAASGSHPHLARYLDVDLSPDRLRRLAQRAARMLRHYAVEAPGLLSAWDAGDDVDALGRPLPLHQSWQAAVHRRATAGLEVDPVGALAELGGTLASAAREPLAVFAVSELGAAHAAVLATMADDSPLDVWSLDGAAATDWVGPLEPEDLPVSSGRTSPSRVEVHSAAGAMRQVEVLRELLLAWFLRNPGAEPRDVVIVTPQPEVWAPLLRSAFEPVSEGGGTSHPGRSLRLQVSSLTQPNLVTAVVRQALDLHRSRATATEVVDLLMTRPVAHRWRLADRRDDIVDLVARSQVRWGLDAGHRTVHGVPGLSQNTWVRGLDRMLTGLAMPPDAHSLPVTGVAAVTSTDLALIGTLAEVVSRLRRFSAEAGEPATVADWASRVLRLLDELVGPSFDDEWMLVETAAAVTDLAASLAHSPARLSRSEFRVLFDQATSEFPPRPMFGNGSLQVVAPSELQHVSKELVCLLGISDDGAGDDADLVALGPDVPSARQRTLRHLLDQARSAKDVLLLHSDRDPCTGVHATQPVTLAWLLRELGTNHTTHAHPLLAHSDDSVALGTFDPSALAAATGLREPRLEAPHVARRRQALALPVPAEPVELTVADLVRTWRDPAKEFLTSRLGMRLFSAPQLDDELPWIEDGLVMWGVRSRLLEALQRGLSDAEALEEERRRETMPPGSIGQARMREALDLVTRLRGRAAEDWEAPLEDRAILIDLGDGLVLRDTIRTRGDQVVAVDAGTGAKVWLPAWLPALALTAAGRNTDAVVHHLRKHYGELFPVQTRLRPPEPGRALELLRHAASGARQARHRLVPAPLDAALAAADQLHSGGINRSLWQLPASDWGCPWSYPAAHWRLFYPASAEELFADGRTAADPASEHEAAFLAWVEAVHLPMLGGKL